MAFALKQHLRPVTAHPAVLAAAPVAAADLVLAVAWPSRAAGAQGAAGAALAGSILVTLVLVRTGHFHAQHSASTTVAAVLLFIALTAIVISRFATLG